MKNIILKVQNCCMASGLTLLILSQLIIFTGSLTAFAYTFFPGAILTFIAVVMGCSRDIDHSFWKDV